MKFNFTSQVCTSRSQSERLLALGLKKETADMCWTTVTLHGTPVTYPAQEVWLDYSVISDTHFPAWSLHRLIEILDIWCLELNFNEFNNAYDQVISYFQERVKGDFIDKEYLERI